MTYTARDQKGFTLIELMMVISIIAILVTLALPAYLDYTIRAKVTECLNSASLPKMSISEYRMTSTPTSWPASASAAAASPGGDSQHCTAFVNYSPALGYFEIDVDENSVGSSISPIQPRMKPFDNVQGGVDWKCSSGSTAPGGVKYLPAICRGPNT